MELDFEENFSVFDFVTKPDVSFKQKLGLKRFKRSSSMQELQRIDEIPIVEESENLPTKNINLSRNE